MTTEEYISGDEYVRLQKEYWRQVAESDGFDIENVLVPSSMTGRITGLIPYYYQLGERIPFLFVAKHYAMLGLHSYNIFKGTTDFQFDALLKFNTLQNLVSSYFITLIAHDQASATRVQNTFQIRIDEKSYGSLDLTVSIARTTTEVTIKKPFIPHYHGGAVADGIFKGELPDWPSDDDLKHTTFYVLNKSEWEEEDSDWISNYLELLLWSNDRSITEKDLSQLEIANVVIESSIGDAPLAERLKAKSANVFIMFYGLVEVRAPRQVFETGVNVRRKAIIRRVMDHSGYLTLLDLNTDDLFCSTSSITFTGGQVFYNFSFRFKDSPRWN